MPDGGVWVLKYYKRVWLYTIVLLHENQPDYYVKHSHETEYNYTFSNIFKGHNVMLTSVKFELNGLY